jgi:hypothetical protein
MSSIYRYAPPVARVLRLCLPVAAILPGEHPWTLVRRRATGPYPSRCAVGFGHRKRLPRHDPARKEARRTRTTRLAGKDLSRADLRGTRRREATLVGTDLSAVYLTGAKLAAASLRCARLMRTDLRYADLAGADSGSIGRVDAVE